MDFASFANLLERRFVLLHDFGHCSRKNCGEELVQLQQSFQGADDGLVLAFVARILSDLREQLSGMVPPEIKDDQDLPILLLG